MNCLLQASRAFERFGFVGAFSGELDIVAAEVTVFLINLQIWDEPSVGLDPRARRTLINLLRDLPITMLVSTHDMKLVEELFPRTIVMDEGLIVADGDTKEILADAKLLEAHGLERP
jgi:cobalt/nickel transport system ATP-binding protein